MKYVRPHETQHSLLLPLAAASLLLSSSVTTMLGPLLVDLVDEFDTSIAVTGQLTTITSLAWAFSAVFAGPFSDRYGRKPLLLLGIGLGAIGSLGAALSPSLLWLIVARFVTGLGGMVPPAIMTTLGDVYPSDRRGRIIGLIVGISGLGPVVAVPLLALLASVFGWRSAFFVAATSLGILLVALTLWFPHTLGSDSARLEFRRRIVHPALLPETRRLLAANFLSRIPHSMLVTYIAAYMITRYDLTLAKIALPIAIIALGGPPAGILGGQIADRPGALIRSATGLMIGGVLSLAIFTFGPTLWISVSFGVLLIISLQLPLPLTLKLFMEASKESRGSIVGVFSLSNQLGIISGAGLGGLALAVIGFAGLGYLGLIASLVSGLLYFQLHLRRTEETRRD